MLPEYTVKLSAKAKYLQLRISQRLGLQVIVPMRLATVNIEEFIHSKQDWIAKHLAKINFQPVAVELPHNISFPAINQEYNIEYIYTRRNLKLLPRPDHSLALFGNIHNKSACHKLLLAWLKQLATSYLSQQLTRLSMECNLPFTEVIVRKQKTVWGTCSHEKVIHLNYCLLFLPPELVRNVLLHELCHTIHLNHSEQFWHLLSQFDPNWRSNAKRVRKAQSYIPAWVDKL